MTQTGILSGLKAEHYSTEARRYVERGEWVMAISFFRRALEEAPDRAMYHHNLGLCLMQALQMGALNDPRVVREAIGHFRNAVLLKMDYPDAWCLLGKAMWLFLRAAKLQGVEDEDMEKIAAAAAMASVLLLGDKPGPVREAAVAVLIDIAMARGYTSNEDPAGFQLGRLQLDAVRWLHALVPWVLGIERDEFYRQFKKALKLARGA